MFFLYTCNCVRIRKYNNILYIYFIDSPLQKQQYKQRKPKKHKPKQRKKYCKGRNTFVQKKMYLYIKHIHK